jgi:hypothetical protein
VKANVITKRVNAIENRLVAIMAALGLGADDIPKTSTRESSQVNPPASLKTRGKKGKSQHEDITITLTPAMLEGRMKLPARVFTKGTKVDVDGHILGQQPQDQNRSTKFNPEIFGYDLDEGDVITFSHVNGRQWTVSSVEAGGKRPAKRAAAKPTPKAAKATPKFVTKKANKGQKTSASTGPRPESFEAFAKLIVANAYDDDFEENENIKQTGSIDGVDSRVLFTTRQNQQFRSFRKNQGLSLKSAVARLNKAVRKLDADLFEDEDDD